MRRTISILNTGSHPARHCPSVARSGSRLGRPRLRRSVAPSLRRFAFSIAEVLIALIILGLGLVFIAAALPVGMDYVRQTNDLALGEAAGEQAANTLALKIGSSRSLSDAGAGLLYTRRDAIFRSRYPIAVPPYAALDVNDSYEPFIKVRPLAMWNISAAPGNGTASAGNELRDEGEELIRAYFLSQSALAPLAGTAGLYTLEVDLDPGVFSNFRSLYDCPVVSALERAYPPVGGVEPLNVVEFLKSVRSPTLNVTYRAYSPRDLTSDASYGTKIVASAAMPETFKARDSRLGWTAFYRRIAYDHINPGPNGVYNGPPWAAPPGDDAVLPSDPLAYELIIVVSRRPSVQHRYATQFLGVGAATFNKPTAINPGTSGTPVDSDRIFPTPWLVTMHSNVAGIPALPYADPNNIVPPVLVTNTPDVRTLKPGAPAPARLTFACNPEVGVLIPPGSILIPAVNDDFPSKARTTNNLIDLPVKSPDNRVAGFVPHQPSALPIYKVIDRVPTSPAKPGDPYLIECENNGAYPWQPLGVSPDYFPFWVVPPPFTQRISSSAITPQPAYETRSTIVAVIRKTIHLNESP